MLLQALPSLLKIYDADPQLYDQEHLLLNK
jgi:hypothetical protein